MKVYSIWNVNQDTNEKVLAVKDLFAYPTLAHQYILEVLSKHKRYTDKNIRQFNLSMWEKDNNINISGNLKLPCNSAFIADDNHEYDLRSRTSIDWILVLEHNIQSDQG